MKSTPPRILICDDVEDIRNILATYFRESQTLHVEFAACGQRAWQMYSEAKTNSQPYDLLILDISMPDHSGLWVAEQIRSTGDKATQIAFFTGIDGVMEHLRAKDVDAHYWLKPMTPRELECKILGALAEHLKTDIIVPELELD